MHSHVIQEDIADSTRSRELVESSPSARRAVIDRQNFSDTKFHGCVSYSNVLRILMCTNVHASDANKLCSFCTASNLLSKLRQAYYNVCVRFFDILYQINDMFCLQYICAIFQKYYVISYLNKSRNY